MERERKLEESLGRADGETELRGLFTRRRIHGQWVIRLDSTAKGERNFPLDKVMLDKNPLVDRSEWYRPQTDSDAEWWKGDSTDIEEWFFDGKP